MARVTVSLITVCYNSAATLPSAFASVLAQRDASVDYHVVDGGSKDGTRELLAEWEGRFRAAGVSFTWTSEPDRGMYDALNKGIARATGDVVGILNADDFFEDARVLADVAAAFRDGAEAIYGDIRFVRGESKETARYYSSRPWRPWMHNWGYMPAHPTVYVTREVFARYGGYKLGYDISADFEWMTRILCGKKGALPPVRAKYVPRCMVTMRLGGKSTGGLKAMWKLNRENVRANRENGYFCCLPMMVPKYFYKIIGYLRRSSGAERPVR